MYNLSGENMNNLLEDIKKINQVPEGKTPI